ncbi:uncharacterized protein SI:CH211-195M9.3 [Latimeria chalumnae]|uniref:uncharacterized protein SI:CH211-195M9.3 n=1 Tax=Latimeria chalumnae TaxID=7897 RepID=UPI00313EE04F
MTKLYSLSLVLQGNRNDSPTSQFFEGRKEVIVFLKPVSHTELICSFFFTGKLSTEYNELESTCCQEVYNPVNQSCCGIHRNVTLNKQQPTDRCCGTELYDMQTQMCTEDLSIRNLSSHYREFETKCCDTKLFLSSNETCCDGEIRADVEEFQCCGTGNFSSQKRKFEIKVCGSELYLSINETCCNGKLRPGGEEFECCGTEVYNPVNQSCCGIHRNVTLNKQQPTDRCCGTELYDMQTQMCTEDLSIRNLSSHYREFETKCCDTKLFLSSNETCCDGEIRTDVEEFQCCGTGNFSSQKRKFEIKVCGSELYLSINETCCNGKLRLGGEEFECCGTEVYNPVNQSCCGIQHNVTLNKQQPTDRRCGTELYDMQTQMCTEDLSIRNLSSHYREFETKCCDTKLFLSSNETCCDGEIRADVEEFQCCGTGNFSSQKRKFEIKVCGSELYLSINETCCNGKLRPGGEEFECCGTEVYNPVNQSCCGIHRNVTLNKQQPTDRCCGTELYDMQTQMCTEDLSIRNLSSHYREFETKCCDTKLFLSSNETCCDGEIRADVEEFQCCGTGNFSSQKRKFEIKVCGSKLYLSINETCCNGKLRPGGEEFECCGTGTYNRSSQLCCGASRNVTLAKNRSTDRCCGERLYNTLTHICSHNDTTISEEPRVDDSNTEKQTRASRSLSKKKACCLGMMALLCSLIFFLFFCKSCFSR